MYQIVQTMFGGDAFTTIKRTNADNTVTWVPVSDDNRDARQFVMDWKVGVEVTDNEGATAPYSDAAVVTLGLTP